MSRASKLAILVVYGILKPWGLVLVLVAFEGGAWMLALPVATTALTIFAIYHIMRRDRLTKGAAPS